MNKKIFGLGLIALLFFLILISGCISKEYVDNNANIDKREISFGVSKIYYADANVTCFIFQEAFAGGISCLEGKK